MLGNITSPNLYTWMFFIDDAPYQNWSHQSRFVFISQSGEATIIPYNYPPSFDNMDILIEQTFDIQQYNPSEYLQNGLSTNIITASSEHQYAVIINGGYDRYNNHERYWNDCAAIYSALIREYGYDKSHIYVLMSDGTNPANDRHRLNGTYDSSPLDFDGDDVADIQYAATKNNITTVFNTLSGIMTNSDNLFIYTMDHGGKSESNEILYLWGEYIFDYQFASEVDKIQAKTINIVMGQCNSGGFIEELSENNRVIATACTADQSSWSMTNGQFDEFVYHWTSAIANHTPLGTIVNADNNNDGIISMQEAFSYAVAHDTKNETPQYHSLPSDLGENLSLGGIMQCSDITYINNKIYPSVLHEIFGINTFNIAGCNIEIANTTIKSNATVNIRATESVILKPGFWAKPGSKVSIKATQPSLSPSLSLSQVGADEDEDRLTALEEAVASQKIGNMDFTVYPNPNDGNFTVKIVGSNAQGYTVEIFNASGSIMGKLDCNAETVHISRNDLPSGIYYLKVSTSGSESTVKKVIVK
jgi:hypothetical protein